MSATDASASGESNSDSEHPIDAALRASTNERDPRRRQAGSGLPRRCSSLESGEVDAAPAVGGGMRTTSPGAESHGGLTARQQPEDALPLDDVLERTDDDTSSSSSGNSAERVEPAAAPFGVLLVGSADGHNAGVQRLLRAPRSVVAAALPRCARIGCATGVLKLCREPRSSW